MSLEENSRLSAVLELLSGAEDTWLVDHRDSQRGNTAFLLGCGPSLNSFDFSLLKLFPVMGVNGTFLDERINMNYHVSVSRIFFKHHIESFHGNFCERGFYPKWVADAITPGEWFSTLNTLDNNQQESLGGSPPVAFSRNPARFVVLGGTVVFVGLQLLYWLGFERVILLGIDHDYGEREKNGHFTTADQIVGRHFRDDYYPAGGNVHIDIAGSERAYRLAKEAFESDGREILNASSSSNLDIFPKVTVKDSGLTIPISL